jgi:membrane-bound ClpP family serine protease
MNWIAELGIILFTFNALVGMNAAILLGVIYLLWGAIKTITAYRMAVKITQRCFDGIKRNKK